MTSPQPTPRSAAQSAPPADLRVLQRGPRSQDFVPSRPPVTLATSVAGQSTPIPRPRGRWATRLLIPLAVLAVTGGILAYAARDALRPRLAVHVAAAIPKAGLAAAASDDPPPPAADGASGQTRLGPVVVQAPGWIEPAPFAVSVPALAEGVVKDVLVLEGERIDAGQVVARLIDDDARLMLRAAQAAVAERAADIERAQAVLATARSQVQVESIAADELRDEVTRKRELVAGGGVGAGEFRRLEIRLRGLEAKVATAENLVAEARAALAQAQAAHGAAVVASDEAGLRLARMDIRSPVAGVVLGRLVEPGSRISMTGDGGGSSRAGASGAGGGPMMGVVIRVYDPANLQVRVDVPLADAAKVGVGTRATISTEALPDRSFSGVVSRVVHEANIQRNTVQFKVTLDEPSPVLKPEMLTRVKLHGSASSAAGDRGEHAASPPRDGDDARGVMLLVPVSAVTRGGEGKGHVWIIDASREVPVARRREIATAPGAEEGFVAVTAGLRLTDRVILDPPALPTLREGTRLNILGERTGPASDAPPASR